MGGVGWYRNETRQAQYSHIPTFRTCGAEYAFAVPTGLQRYYGSQDLHFITCSCYQRRPLLGTPARRTLFLKILEQIRTPAA